MNFSPGLLLPLVLGVCCMGYVSLEYRRIQSAKSWAKIPARVLKSRVIKHVLFDEGTEYFLFEPQVDFEYQESGQLVRSSQLCLDAGAYRFPEFEKAYVLIKSFPDDKHIEIYQSKTGEVVLMADIDSRRKQGYLAFFLMGLLCAMVSPGLIWLFH